MRVCLLLILAAYLGGCASPSVAPREYLDEQTAATITVVAEPWIFTRQDAPRQFDFFNLYAIDVNRMGDHKKYLVVVQYWPEAGQRGVPALELNGPSRQLALQAVNQTARELGVAQPLDETAPDSARYWFYPIDDAALKEFAKARELTATLVAEQVRTPYVVWRDGSLALSEFAGVVREQ